MAKADYHIIIYSNDLMAVVTSRKGITCGVMIDGQMIMDNSKDMSLEGLIHQSFAIEKGLTDPVVI